MTAYGKTSPNGARIERWAVAVLLLFPLVMTQVGREWTWFVAMIAGGVIGILLLLVELVTRKSGNPAYRAGATIALAVSFLLVWVTVVGGITGNQANQANTAFLILPLTATVGAFAAGARPPGMARAMLGIAAVQAFLTALAVTDPSTAHDPRGIAGVLTLSGYFTALWLVSAACFRQAANRSLPA